MTLYSLHKTATVFVWTVHIVFVSLLVFQPHWAPKKKQQKPLIVKTITPKPLSVSAPKPTQKKIAAPQAPTPSAKPLAAKQNPTQVPKKSASPAPVKNTVQAASSIKKEAAIADKQLSKTKATPPKTTPPSRASISDSLLQELEQSLAKIEHKTERKRGNQKSQKIAPLVLEIDSNPTDLGETENFSYAEILGGYLRQTLSLPDYGEVKIQLSLRQDGSVVKIVVLRAESKENKRYLEEHLPFIRFPRFEGKLASNTESTFILTFVNEM